MVCTSCHISFSSFLEIISNEECLLSFLQEHEVFPENVECPRCKRLCKFYPDDSLRFKCTSSQLVSINKRKKKRVFCNFSVSARKDTFFEKSRLPLITVCKFISLWLVFPPPRQILIENELNLSPKTIVDWCGFSREVCLVCMINESEQIGGPNKIVEIHDAKMAQNKYNRGNVIQGRYVFGGIERDSNKCFLIPVNEKEKDILLDIIRKWILPGTTIMSHCWRSYNCLADEGFQYEMANNFKYFVDPDTGAHTQNIERLCKDARSTIPRFGRYEDCFGGYLAECQFRMKYSNHMDRFHHFFKYMAHVQVLIEDSGQASENSDELITVNM